MVRSACFLVVSCALLTALPPALPAAEADSAAEAFESLYGSDVKRVQATRDAKDDVELAGRLLEAARKTTGQPAFLAVLCEKACDLASGHPDGYATAIEAMELLAGEVPDQAAACAERVAEIRQKQFNASRGDEQLEAGDALIAVLLYLVDGKLDAGDPPGAAAFCRRAQKVARVTKSERMKEIDAHLRRVAQTMRAKREAEHLKAQLRKNPNDVAAREKLVRLCLVDLDNPAVAVEYVAGVADESLRKYVPAVAKGAEAAPELACAELGDWYRGLAEKALSGAKPAMYARARGYYERFLELHAAEDLRRTAVSLALKKVEAAVEKLGPAAPSKLAKGRWIDLVTLVDPAKDAVKGEWKRHSGMLTITKPINHGRIVIPVAPEGGYELQVKFVRTSGYADVAVILPVGSARVKLGLSAWSGEVSGLEMIDGKDTRDDEAAVRPGTLVNGREYALDIMVIAKGDQARIAVRLDGKPYIDWRGPQSALSMHPAWDLREPRCLGLGVHVSLVVFRSVRLKMLTGKVRLLKPPTGAKAPSAVKPTTAASAPPGPIIKPGRWIDLLPLVDPAKDAVKGDWKRQGGMLTITKPIACGRIMMPVAPEGSYELQAKFVRTSGDDYVAIMLPVGSARVTLCLSGWHGAVSGLDMINGKNAHSNKTTIRPGTLVNGHEYALHITVLAKGDQAQIAVRLDGKPYIAWGGSQSALSLHPLWALPKSGCLGLGAWGPTVVFRTVRLKMLTGKARLVRPKDE